MLLIDHINNSGRIILFYISTKESTLNGIFKNVKTFKDQCLIDNLEIVVVIIYDGMNKLCTNTDEEMVDIDEDMLEYFM